MTADNLCDEAIDDLVELVVILHNTKAILSDKEKKEIRQVIAEIMNPDMLGEIREF